MSSLALSKTTTAFEQTCGSCLIQFAYCLINNLEAKLVMYNYANNHYTNYFYEDVNAVKLCVPDIPSLREQAEAAGISHIMWFGYNTDPVIQVPLHEVCAERLVKFVESG